MVRFATDHRYVWPCAFKEVGFDCLKTHEHIFHLLRCPGPNTAGRCQVVACQKETIVFQRPVFVVIFWLQLPPTNSLHPKLTKKTTEASVPDSQHSFVVQEQTNLHCRVKLEIMAGTRKTCIRFWTQKTPMVFFTFIGVFNLEDLGPIYER